MGSFGDNLKAMVRIFRRECYKVLESERTTIRGSDSMLMVLQLVMAEVNKQATGEFTVALSDVLFVWLYFLREKLQLPLTDCLRPERYDAIRMEYDSFLNRTNTVDLIDVSRMYLQLRTESDPEELLSSVQLLEFLTGSMEDSKDSSQTSCDQTCPQTPSKGLSQDKLKEQRVLRQIFCSYLELLVNSKNDLAVARTLNLPCRELGHSAFTDLRHEARAANTSLFLAATSFVRAIQLGGRGYAPPASHPLRKHLKGLLAFVSFIDHLEEILGETSHPSLAGEKLVASVRASLLKGRCNGDPVTMMAQTVAHELRCRIGQIHSSQRVEDWHTGISPAQPKAYAINHATAYRGRDTVKVLRTLLDEEALLPPCRNKAELLYGDRGTLDGDGGSCTLSLFRSPEAVTGCLPAPLRHRVQERRKPELKERRVRSQFACTYREDAPVNRLLIFPHARQVAANAEMAPEPGYAPEVKERRAEALQQSAAVRRAPLGSREVNCSNGTGEEDSGGKRRRIEGEELSEAEHCPPRKRGPAPSALSGNKTCGQLGKKGGRVAHSKRKLMPGQAKLTSFFRL